MAPDQTQARVSALKLTGTESREEQLAYFADLIFQAAIQVRTLRQIALGNQARLVIGTEAWQNAMSLTGEHFIVDRWFEDKCAMLAALMSAAQKTAEPQPPGLH